MFHFALKGIDNDLGHSKINRRKIRYLKYSNGYSRNDPHSPFPLLNKWIPPPLPLACPTTIDPFPKQEAQFAHIMNPNK